jgi:hypothetical protein
MDNVFWMRQLSQERASRLAAETRAAIAEGLSRDLTAAAGVHKAIAKRDAMTAWFCCRALDKAKEVQKSLQALLDAGTLEPAASAAIQKAVQDLGVAEGVANGALTDQEWSKMCREVDSDHEMLIELYRARREEA